MGVVKAGKKSDSGVVGKGVRVRAPVRREEARSLAVAKEAMLEVESTLVRYACCEGR